MIHFDLFVLDLIHAKDRLNKVFPQFLHHVQNHAKHETITDSIKRCSNELEFSVAISERRSVKMKVINLLTKRFDPHIAHNIWLFICDELWFNNHRYVKLSWISEGMKYMFKHDCTGLDINDVLCCNDRFSGERIDQLKEYNLHLLNMQESSQMFDFRKLSRFHTSRFSSFFCVDFIGEIFLCLFIRFSINDTYGGVLLHRVDFPAYKMVNVFNVIKYRLEVDELKVEVNSGKVAE